MCMAGNLKSFAGPSLCFGLNFIPATKLTAHQQCYPVYTMVESIPIKWAVHGMQLDMPVQEPSERPASNVGGGPGLPPSSPPPSAASPPPPQLQSPPAPPAPFIFQNYPPPSPPLGPWLKQDPKRPLDRPAQAPEERNRSTYRAHLKSPMPPISSGYLYPDPIGSRPPPPIPVVVQPPPRPANPPGPPFADEPLYTIKAQDPPPGPPAESPGGAIADHPKYSPPPGQATIPSGNSGSASNNTLGGTGQVRPCIC